MQRIVVLLVILLCPGLVSASDVDIGKEIIALERSAMDAWLKGSPDRMLELADTEISFLHADVGRRLDLAGLKNLCNDYRGRPLFDRYEMLDTKVQVVGDIAILSYVLTNQRGPMAGRWNATQVYRRSNDSWRVIHTHWSTNRKEQ